MSLFDRCPFSVVVVVLGAADGRAGAQRRAGDSVLAAATVLLLAWTGVLLALGASPALADSCPNAQFRTGSAANLPDCRAYEQVTPSDKSDQDGAYEKNGFIAFPYAAVDGGRAAYFSFGGFADSPAANSFYLATHGASSWSSQGIVPPQSVATSALCIPGYVAYSTNLERGVLADGANQSFGCGADDPSLVPDEPQGHKNLFVRDNQTGTYQLVNVTPSTAAPADANFQGASPDLSHVVFDENAPLTAGATTGDLLYEWAGGSVSLVGQVPTAPATSCSGSACAPVAGAKLGNGSRVAGTVSGDGSRVYFSANNGAGNLWVRDGDTTTQVDASQGGAGHGGGLFQTASADGSSVLFSDTQQLTSDASPSGADLYRYDAASGTLTDLTANPSGAAVLGVVGASNDAGRVYFVANGDLGGAATAGQPNLYLWHGGTTTFIATLAPSDSADWSPGTAIGSARVSADGSHVAFTSTLSLTGYDNADANTGSPDKEVFLYDAGTGQLACASCNPSGARPIGPSTIDGQVKQQIITGAPSPASNLSETRNLSADGSRLFFDSSDALVPGDKNSEQDVYEYEGGNVNLISSGTSDRPSWFWDAGANGDDVFFLTYQQLVGQDTDGLQDLYDARVVGGFPFPQPPTPCTGDACLGAPSVPPAAPTAASVTFSGPGNASPTLSVSPTPSVKVFTKSVRGSTFRVRVRAPGSGQIVISGAGIKTVRRSVAKAGTYQLRVTLTAQARRKLARKRRLRPRLHVRFSPPAGQARVATFTLTIKPAAHRPSTHPGRTASSDRGGVK